MRGTKELLWCACASCAVACGYVGYETPASDAEFDDEALAPTNEPDEMPPVAVDPAQIDVKRVIDCDAPTLLPGTIALLHFDQVTPVMNDATGVHTAYIDGPVSWSAVDGPAGCGSAVRFDENNSSGFVRIPDAPAWAIASGSIDMWIRPEVCPTTADQRMGLWSRSQGNAEPAGEHAFFLSNACELTVFWRDNEGAGQWSETNTFVETAQWTHVGLNFGPDGLSLWLNGTVVFSQSLWDVSLTPDVNDWAFGTDIGVALPDTIADRVVQSLAFDHIRISDVQRDFGSTVP